MTPVESGLDIGGNSMADCPNCDGRKCMGCVCREWDHECKHDCPLCCHPPASVAPAGGMAGDGHPLDCCCPNDERGTELRLARRHLAELSERLSETEDALARAKDENRALTEKLCDADEVIERHREEILARDCRIQELEGDER